MVNVVAWAGLDGHSAKDAAATAAAAGISHLLYVWVREVRPASIDPNGHVFAPGGAGAKGNGNHSVEDETGSRELLCELRYQGVSHRTTTARAKSGRYCWSERFHLYETPPHSLLH